MMALMGLAGILSAMWIARLFNDELYIRMFTVALYYTGWIVTATGLVIIIIE